MDNSGQFSIRAILIVTAIIAVLCCILFTLPIWLSAIFLIVASLLAMPAALCALIYGRGRVQAFATGTMPPLLIICMWFTGAAGFPLFNIGPGDSLEFKILFSIVMFVVVASGFVGQAVRWWCVKGKGLNKRSNKGVAAVLMGIRTR